MPRRTQSGHADVGGGCFLHNRGGTIINLPRSAVLMAVGNNPAAEP
jgi:hypothetical protein